MNDLTAIEGILEELEEHNSTDMLTEEELDWAQEWLYINIPEHYHIDEEEKILKMEIEL